MLHKLKNKSSLYRPKILQYAHGAKNETKNVLLSPLTFYTLPISIKHRKMLCPSSILKRKIRNFS